MVYCFPYRNLLSVVLLFLLQQQLKSQLVINELFVTNASADLHTNYNYPDWVEVYNASGVSVMGSVYYLSNDSANLKQWQLPSNAINVGEYKAFFLNDVNGGTNYTNFKANDDGGCIYLSDATGKVIDRLCYNKQFYNISYGRIPDGKGSFKYLKISTRETKNTNETLQPRNYNLIFSHKGGFYNSGISLSITKTLGDGAIYYTLDGSEPGIGSKVYTKPIRIQTTTIVRIRIIEEGSIPGDIITETFFISERNHSMPVISIVTDPRNFFDNKLGIYIAGTNGIPGNCDETLNRNWNRDWERPANFELFDQKGNQVVNQITGIKIAGGCSRQKPQKSLAINARGKYGKDRLKYAFFKDRNFENFNSILLRNGGNDFDHTIYRDHVFQKLSDRHMNIDHQAGQPAVIYINGEYYGIQFIYERSGEDLVEASYGLDQEKIDLGELNGVPIQGNVSSYKQLLNFVNSNHLGVKANYDKVAAQIDIDNYIEYLILQMYIGNGDFPGNNSKYWKRTTAGSKWRWILFDTDFGFQLYDNHNSNMFQLMLDSTASGWPNPEWSNRLFRKLIQNPGFKAKFVNRFYAHINTSFRPDLVINTIDSIASLISHEVPYHFSRWGVDSDWEYNILQLKDYAVQRPEIVRLQLQEFMGTGEDVLVQCNTVGEGSGYLSVEGVVSTDTSYIGTFPKNMIARIKFVPAAGYEFKKAIRNAYDAGKLQLIKTGDSWKYFDLDPININANWYDTSFNDQSWKTGDAQFGFGEGDEKTLISYGTNTASKYITSYYRRSFVFDTSLHTYGHTLRILADDGAIVYLNGKEFTRINMPDTIVNYQTLATVSADENVYMAYYVPDSLLVHGKNIIAAEVHQNSPNSTDLSFDLNLYGDYFNPQITISAVENQEFTDTIKTNVFYHVYYKKSEPVKNLVINEVAPRNKLFADEFDENDDWVELYNNSSDSIGISGLFITDSLQNPTLYRIPVWNGKPAKIAPNDYLILWADKQVKQGALHMNFKLDAKREEIGIFQKIGDQVICLDSVSFALDKDYQSVGRIPNITGDFRNLFHASYNAENIDLPFTEVARIQEQNDFVTILFYPGQKILSLEFSEQIGLAGVKVTDIQGRIMSFQKTSGSNFQLNMQSYKRGIYLILVEKPGMRQTKKLTIY